MPKIRVGVVGAGSVTSGSHLPVLVNMPDVSVEWVCDRSLPTATRVARAYGIPRVFGEITRCSDVDVVMIATPVGTRRALVPEVLARGWHAFCEKPFALTVEDHEAFVDAARVRNLQIGVAQVRRYAKPAASARAMLRQDAFGPIERVLSAEGFRMRGTGRSAGWHLNDRAAGGVLAEFGSHLIDQVFYVLGATSATVRDCTRRVHRGLEVATSVLADVAMPAGNSFACSIDLSLIEDLCNGVFIEFPKAVLRIGLGFDDGLTLLSKDGKHVANLEMPEGVASPVQGFYLEWRDFLQQCRTGEPGNMDARSVALTTSAIASAAVVSERANQSSLRVPAA